MVRRGIIITAVLSVSLDLFDAAVFGPEDQIAPLPRHLLYEDLSPSGWSHSVGAPTLPLAGDAVVSAYRLSWNQHDHEPFVVRERNLGSSMQKPQATAVFDDIHRPPRTLEGVSGPATLDSTVGGSNVLAVAGTACSSQSGSVYRLNWDSRCVEPQRAALSPSARPSNPEPKAGTLHRTRLRSRLFAGRRRAGGQRPEPMQHSIFPAYRLSWERIGSLHESMWAYVDKQEEFVQSEGPGRHVSDDCTNRAKSASSAYAGVYDKSAWGSSDELQHVSTSEQTDGLEMSGPEHAVDSKHQSQFSTQRAAARLWTAHDLRPQSAGGLDMLRSAKIGIKRVASEGREAAWNALQEKHVEEETDRMGSPTTKNDHNMDGSWSDEQPSNDQYSSHVVAPTFGTRGSISDMPDRNIACSASKAPDPAHRSSPVLGVDAGLTIATTTTPDNETSLRYSEQNISNEAHTTSLVETAVSIMAFAMAFWVWVQLFLRSIEVSPSIWDHWRLIAKFADGYGWFFEELVRERTAILVVPLAQRLGWFRAQCKDLYTFSWRRISEYLKIAIYDIGADFDDTRRSCVRYTSPETLLQAGNALQLAGDVSPNLSGLASECAPAETCDAVVREKDVRMGETPACEQPADAQCGGLPEEPRFHQSTEEEQCVHECRKESSEQHSADLMENVHKHMVDQSSVHLALDLPRVVGWATHRMHHESEDLLSQSTCPLGGAESALETEEETPNDEFEQEIANEGFSSRQMPWHKQKEERHDEEEEDQHEEDIFLWTDTEPTECGRLALHNATAKTLTDKDEYESVGRGLVDGDFTGSTHFERKRKWRSRRTGPPHEGDHVFCESNFGCSLEIGSGDPQSVGIDSDCNATSGRFLATYLPTHITHQGAGNAGVSSQRPSRSCWRPSLRW